MRLGAAAYTYGQLMHVADLRPAMHEMHEMLSVSVMSAPACWSGPGLFWAWSKQGLPPVNAPGHKVWQAL